MHSHNHPLLAQLLLQNYKVTCVDHDVKALKTTQKQIIKILTAKQQVNKITNLELLGISQMAQVTQLQYDILIVDLQQPRRVAT